MISSTPVLQNHIDSMRFTDNCPECSGKGIIANPTGARIPVCCPTCDGYGFVRSKKEGE